MDGLSLFLVILILVIVALTVRRVRATNAHQRAMTGAYTDYQMALKKLKANPSNADLKQSTLALGRSYSALTREDKSVTVFDEIALMNDINAATAGAMTSTPAAPVAPVVSNVEDRLRQLESLRTKGLVTDGEYQERRTKILSDV